MQFIPKLFVSVALMLVLTSCAFLEKTQPTIPTETISALSHSNTKRMVIVLPGRGDTLAVMRNSGIAAVIQEQMPDADVMLVEMTLAYYMEGRSVQRLQEQVVQQARQQGYREIYLAGASMGGMGVLMYEREYPNQMSGLLLMAPYMGDASLMKEIKAAGGLSHWDAGPAPEQLNRDNVPREEWRVAQSWLHNPERAKQVWLVCGQSDKFHEAAGLIADALPRDHYTSPVGGHAWKVWIEGAKEALAKMHAPQ